MFFKEVLVRVASWVIAATKKALSLNQIIFEKIAFDILWSIVNF